MTKRKDNTDHIFSLFMGAVERLAEKGIDIDTFDNEAAQYALFLDCDIDNKKVKDESRTRDMISVIDLFRLRAKEADEYGGAHIVARLYLDAMENGGQNNEELRAELLAQQVTFEFNHNNS